MWIAEAAIHRSLAWARSASGWASLRHAKRSPAAVVSKRSLTGTTVVALILEAVPPRDSPSGDQRAVSELADRDGSEEDLVAGHQLHLGVEPWTATQADGCAEDAGIDEDSHAPSAAANALSSSSDSSSITSASIDASTGAVAS